MAESDEPRPVASRVAWMAIIWLVSVTLLGVVAMLLRWWIGG